MPEIPDDKLPTHLQSGQLWKHQAAPLILGILQTSAVQLTRSGRTVGAEQKPTGECVLTVVDGSGSHHLCFQAQTQTYRVRVIEREAGRPPRRVGETSLRDLAAPWVEERLGQFIAAVGG